MRSAHGAARVRATPLAAFDRRRPALCALRIALRAMRATPLVAFNRAGRSAHSVARYARYALSRRRFALGALPLCRHIAVRSAHSAAQRSASLRALPLGRRRRFAPAPCVPRMARGAQQPRSGRMAPGSARADQISPPSSNSSSPLGGQVLRPPSVAVCDLRPLQGRGAPPLLRAAPARTGVLVCGACVAYVAGVPAAAPTPRSPRSLLEGNAKKAAFPGHFWGVFTPFHLAGKTEY